MILQKAVADTAPKSERKDDEGAGQIRTKATYDFEQKIGYAVIVRASDGREGASVWS